MPETQTSNPRPEIEIGNRKLVDDIRAREAFVGQGFGYNGLSSFPEFGMGRVHPAGLSRSFYPGLDPRATLTPGFGYASTMSPGFAYGDAARLRMPSHVAPASIPHASYTSVGLPPMPYGMSPLRAQFDPRFNDRMSRFAPNQFPAFDPRLSASSARAYQPALNNRFL